MPSESRSASAGSRRSSNSRAERASGSMGHDGGEVGRRMAAEDELIRRELADTTSFCNAFWGINDSGYDVMQARMKGANKTLDELRAMFRERAEIEADYSKRLAKLSKAQLGRDENGLMRSALDTIRAELDTSAKAHSNLAASMRQELEGSVADFQGRVNNARKNSAVSIEKLYKQKQAQETYVNRSREKYEQDCIKINGYTAQSSLVQGRDLDKVAAKLDKAQSTVGANEKDYQNFVRAFKDTSQKWVVEWKAYLDQCQDLEEERLDFMKGTAWNYANAVSTVCVADDESCERVRVSLENCETHRDIIAFIQHAGTGSTIPDPPEYINYAKGQPPPPRPTFRAAEFQRNTSRPPQAPVQQPPPQQQPPVDRNGADATSRRGSSGGSQSGSQAPPPNQPQQQGGYRPPPGAVAMPGMTSTAANSERTFPAAQDTAVHPPPLTYQPQTAGNVAPPSDSQSIGAARRMSAKNFLARAPSISQSSRDPPLVGGIERDRSGHTGGLSGSGASAASSGPPRPAPDTAQEEEDPIARALANLRARPGARSPAPPSTPAQQAPPPLSKSPAPSGLSTLQSPYEQHRQQQQAIPNRAPSPSPSFRGGGSAMRAPSPSPSFDPSGRRSPSAAFMQGPPRSPSPLQAAVDDVLSQYGQAFPGERRLSRQNSNASHMSGRPPSHHGGGPSASSASQLMQPGATPDRSRSPRPDQSFAGVGARGRSPSPAPFARPDHQQQASHQQQTSSQQQRPPQQSSMQLPPQQQPPPRSTTPLGIALDATGSVTHDEMADEYMRRGGSVPPPQQPQQPQGYGQAPQTIAPAAHRPQALYAQGTSQLQAAGLHQQHPSSVSHHGSFAQAGPPSQLQTQPAYGHQVQTSQYAASPGGYAAAPTTGYHSASPSTYSQNTLSGPNGASQPAPNSIGRANGYVANPYGSHAAGASQASYGGTPQHLPPQQQSQYIPPGNVSPGRGTTPSHDTSPAGSYLTQQYPQAAAHPQSFQQQQQPAPAQAPVAAAAPAQAPVQSNGQAHPPTGQFSDSGQPILFYVKALYDYAATTAEEFSFTAGDIIAVTHTEPDGWWQGELLDEARRRHGANTFPSNFVVLLM